MHLSFIFALLPLPISYSFPWFFYLLVLSCSYIMRELVAKNALASSSLHAYLSDWVNVLISLRVHDRANNQVPRIPLAGCGMVLELF